ncbi:hypothetical protein PENSPDRAFT_386451 [Peniophora sp. CONT]|nr:hypothetical protein PENSPDRAFT_386451 [Peniophora sp. CONT]
MRKCTSAWLVVTVRCLSFQPTGSFYSALNTTPSAYSRDLRASRASPLAHHDRVPKLRACAASMHSVFRGMTNDPSVIQPCKGH